MPNIKLTDKQKEFLPCINWYLDVNHRAKGRTFLLAYAAIKWMLKNRGEKYVWVDWCPNPTRERNYQTKYAIENIWEVFQKDKRYQKYYLEYNAAGAYFVISKKR